MTDVWQTFRYSIVSGLCLILHNVIMIVSDIAGWAFYMSIMFSFCLVAITGYILHSCLTFREPLNPLRFVRYVVAVSANIPIAFITVWFWHEIINLKMIWASPIATACMMGVNYVLGKWAIVTRKSQVI